MNRIVHAIAKVLLFPAALALAFFASRADPGPRGQIIAMAIAALIGLVPSVSRRICRLADRLKRIPPRRHFITACVVNAISLVYLLIAADSSGRDWFPRLHDEQRTLLQMRMIAVGRLWMPRHELADFFEAPHVFVKPVYASMYFPGAALLYVPVIWLHAPTWIAPVLASAACAAVLWLIMADMVDPFAATLSALLLLSIGKFRYLSFILMPHTPMLLLGLLSIWAWLKWRKSRTAGWLLLVGALSGWGAITRPVDAIAYAVPIGVAILLNLKRDHRLRSLPRAALLILLGSLPFLALQLIDNYGITSHLFKTPYHQYMDENSPEVAYGLPAGGAIPKPQTTLLQKLVYDRRFNQPEIAADASGRMKRWLMWKFPIIARAVAPTAILLFLAPFGLLLNKNDRWVLPAVFAAWVGLYLPFAFMLGHYPVVAAPGAIAAIVLGIYALPALWPKMHDLLFASLTLAVAVASFYSLRSALIPPGDDPLLFDTVSYAQNRLSKDVITPAVVLVRFREFNNPHQEIVYNTDALNPDDESIIKAHDLGPDRDAEIIKYYAAAQPTRHFYLLDRGLAELKPLSLGTAAELAGHLPALPPELAHPTEIPEDQAWKTKLLRND